MANVKFTDLNPSDRAPTLAGTDILAVTTDPDNNGAGATSKATTITNLMGQAPVQSVAGQTGIVLLTSTDIGGLGTAATTASTDYATATQGATADSATQPGDGISTLTNDSGFITGLSAGALSDFDFDDNAIFGFKASLPSEIADATYTVADEDNGKVIRVNHASGCTVTIPNGLLTSDSSGFNCSFVQIGAGAITFANDGTSVINNRQSHTKTNGQWAVASVVSTANNVFVLAGDTTS